MYNSNLDISENLNNAQNLLNDKQVESAENLLMEIERNFSEEDEYFRPVLYFLYTQVCIHQMHIPRAKFCIEKAKQSIPKAMEDFAFSNSKHVFQDRIDQLYERLSEY